MIFDINGAPDTLLKIRSEVVGSRPLQVGSSKLVSVDRVVFELFKRGDLTETVACGLPEMGLAEDDRPPSDAALNAATLPPQVTTLIERAFDGRPDDELLWLWLSEPYRYLPALPFESLFARVIPTHPVMRLSVDNVAAALFKESRESVLCFSCPGDPTEAVERYLRIMPPDERLKGHIVHVFADPTARKLLEGQKEAFVLHEPPPSLETLLHEEAVSVATPYDARHPWIAWMLDVLESRSIDFVHFVCHGHLASHQGALIFAEPVMIDDARTTRPLYAAELDRFLDRLGAWWVSISSPPGNPSIGGLRFFEEELAQMRYGPVVLQDLEQDPDGSDMIDSVEFYLNSEPIAPSRSAVRYWNPNRSAIAPFTDLKLNVAPEAANVLRRAMETAIARYNRIPENEGQEAIKEGIGKAVAFAYNVLAGEHLL